MIDYKESRMMKLRHFYLLICFLGLILPYSQFILFLTKHGLNLTLFTEQLFANPISRFFALDVFISAIALIAFIFADGARMALRHLWLPVVATLTVGVSLGLPLLLYMRQLKLDKNSI